MQGATRFDGQHFCNGGDFNPRSLCRERLRTDASSRHTQEFQSTLPMQGATRAWRDKQSQICISIHAPYAGSDIAPNLVYEAYFIFQSTLPMQGATVSAESKYLLFKFQSTLPMQGATSNIAHIAAIKIISIHAPYAGSDLWLPI